ncbi:response regulator [Sulfitobacter dubius]|uniref:Transcriptional regulatory protein SrrA n=1 Tax=Sulfitobacter dubius TaxID=218673 RepID=A0ABY3ZPM4_9RHOB|nr:response regulator [Sulfitobacter dubius]UOA16609.1 Transcriptional regulatory protein SrrA [Sulfitobacter dubius]
MEILAVDDDPIIRDLVQTTLSAVNACEITTASSGAEALEILSAPETKFDCLLLDIEMPEMDGIALCRKIRSLPGYLYTPILMLTQRTDAIAVGRAFVAGATDYVTKPFEAGDLRSRLRVAERMMKRTEATLHISAQDLETGSPGVHHFDDSQAVHIEDIPQLVLPFSLGAYLSQLSRSSLDDCHVFAVSIDNFQQLYANGTTAEVRTAIVAVTRLIAQSISCPELLMTHNGGGMLLCVVTTEHLPDWDDVEDAIQRQLGELVPCYEHGGKMNLTLSIGKPIQPNASATQRVKRTFDRAIQRVKSARTESLTGSQPDLHPAAAAS